MIVKEEELQAFAKKHAGKSKKWQDFFAPLYIKKWHHLERETETLFDHCAFGNTDYGIDAFYFDPEKNFLYLYQFKWSDDHNLFAKDYERLQSVGFKTIFNNDTKANSQNDMLSHLHDELDENRAVLKKILLVFVFNGDKDSADDSPLLSDAQDEFLRSAKVLVSAYFNRDVEIAIRYESNRDETKGLVKKSGKIHRYQLDAHMHFLQKSIENTHLYLGFVSLWLLHQMHKEMGDKLFEKNIRVGLDDRLPAKKGMLKSFEEIVEGKKSAESFSFLHNGISLAVEHFDLRDKNLVEPRVLNGAQTITALSRYYEKVEALKSEQGKEKLVKIQKAMLAIELPCKIIARGDEDFITEVTIANNRQTPVDAWSLRAHDRIQLKIEARFFESKIFYERQDNLFKHLQAKSPNYLQEQGYANSLKNCVTLRKFAITLITHKGRLDWLRNLGNFFENKNQYEQIFDEAMLSESIPVSKFVLLYKIHLRLNFIKRLMKEDAGEKYLYLERAGWLIHALLMQAVLNDEKQLAFRLENYGTTMVMHEEYINVLKDLGIKKVLVVLKDLLRQDEYKEKVANNQFDFLRSEKTFKACMDVAKERFGWTLRKLY